LDKSDESEDLISVTALQVHVEVDAAVADLSFVHRLEDLVFGRICLLKDTVYSVFGALNAGLLLFADIGQVKVDLEQLIREKRISFFAIATAF